MAGQLRPVRPSTSLPAPSAGAFEEGFRQEGGCFVLIGTAPTKTNVRRTDFQDDTGFECFMNRIHAFDYCETGSVADALGFVLELFRLWRAVFHGRTLRAILSCRGEDTVVRWHLLRDGEAWLDGDLEKYEEAVLEIDSTDPWLFGEVAAPLRTK
jgi:hypothetical protein